MPMSSAGCALRSSSSMAAIDTPRRAPIIVAASSPSVSRAITCEPLSESSRVGGLFQRRQQEIVVGLQLAWRRRCPSPTASMSSSPSSSDSSPRAAEIERLFQRQAAVGRIDQRDAAVAADGHVAAGAAAAEHQIVVFQVLAAEIDGRPAARRAAGAAGRSSVGACCLPASGLRPSVRSNSSNCATFESTSSFCLAAGRLGLARRA